MFAAIVFDGMGDLVAFLIAISIGTGIGRLLADLLLFWWRR